MWEILQVTFWEFNIGFARASIDGEWEAIPICTIKVWGGGFSLNDDDLTRLMLTLINAYLIRRAHRAIRDGRCNLLWDAWNILTFRKSLLQYPNFIFFLQGLNFKYFF